MPNVNFSDNFQGNRPSVTAPEIYPAKLVKITIEDITNKDDVVTFKDVVKFDFELANGCGYTHVEFPIKETEAETIIAQYTADQTKKLGNVYQRIGHILKNHVPIELITHKEISDQLNWRMFLGLYKNAFEEAVAKADVIPLFVKILGSVYMNKAKLGFPSYIGFVGTTAESIAMGKKEKEGNAEWAQFQTNKSAMSENPMGAELPGNTTDAGLDFKPNDAPF